MRWDESAARKSRVSVNIEKIGAGTRVLDSSERKRKEI